MTDLQKRLTAANGALPDVPEQIPHGDMPGDSICISESHIRKAKKLLPVLLDALQEPAGTRRRLVVSIFGGSGVGKSEIASLLAWYLGQNGIKSYILSGDNYPHRIPMYNDAERERVFRTSGLKGLLDTDCYNSQVQKDLDILWADSSDAAPQLQVRYPWLSIYQQAGRRGLEDYLGTEQEQDFGELNKILRAFRRGDSRIWLKRMGRTENERWYDPIDFSDTDLMIVEWTHGGSPLLEGVDVPVFLHSTPQETLAHRQKRARDGKTDRPFTTMVLQIEQEKLAAYAEHAEIWMSKSGEIVRPAPEREGSE